MPRKLKTVHVVQIPTFVKWTCECGHEHGQTYDEFLEGSDPSDWFCQTIVCEKCGEVYTIADIEWK